MLSNKKSFAAFFLLLSFFFSNIALSDIKDSTYIPTLPDDLESLWLRPSNGAVVEGYKCEKGYGLRIVKSPKPEYVGRELGCAVETKYPNKLHGDMLNPYDGKTYSGYVKMIDKNTLRLEGCVLFGMICRGENWKRLSHEEFEKMKDKN